MSVEFQLARFACGVAYDNLGREVIEAAKRNIFDTIGNGIAGSHAAGMPQLVSYAEEMGGRQSSTILARGTRVPPSQAAFVNASLCHALDYDDTHDRAVLHTGTVVVPAAFAAAEYVGGVSGRQLVAAVVAGEDIHCRLGLATKLWIGWMLTPLYGYFGAAAAAGAILGLDEEGMVNAFGIAYAQAAGNTETIHSGSLTKRVQAGFASSGGVTAALLAKRGITGAEKSIEGRDGMFNLYQRGEFDAGALESGLGERFEIVNLSYKPYPCCRFNHSGVDAVLRIVSEHDITPDEVEEIRVGASRAGYVNNCEPIEVKRRPRTPVDAQFSTPYAIACALVKGELTPAHFSEESIHDPVVLDIASRVHPFIDPDIDKEAGREISPMRVAVTLKSGVVYSAGVDVPRGHPLNQMSDQDFDAKFRTCALHGAGAGAEERAGLLMERLKHLDRVRDIAEVTTLFRLEE